MDDGGTSEKYVVHAAQAFAAVVRKHPHKDALIWSAESATSFDRLDRYSNQIARILLDRGVRKRDVVCICLEKSPLAFAAIIGCLKIGAPYFVVDPANPPARTRTMCDRCAPALAIAASGVPTDLFGSAILASDENLDALVESVDDGPVTVPWNIDGSDPAYVMFTSGSTGTPKGVTISQNNLVNFIQWSRAEFRTRPEDRFTNLNPLFFDNSVFDIFASLFSGAALVPFTANMMKEPRTVVDRISTLQCTVYFSVPSLLVYLQTLKLIDGDSFPSLRTMIFGGEGYPKPMLARLHEVLGKRIDLINVYGPTECTCICTAYRIDAADLQHMSGYAPLGHLIPNFSGVIVDEAGASVDDGEVGELCLGGPCVGLGYIGDPQQTARAFVQNPTHNRFFDRVYKTGDLVRVDPADRKLHFIGRADSQIKHQGYRIELAEIEHALCAIEGVDEAAALYVRAQGGGRIVAVVGSTAGLTTTELKTALAHRLPVYMVPGRIVLVGQLPKNANGKTDRAALAASVARAPA